MFQSTQRPCSYFMKKLNNTLGYFGDNSNLHGVHHVISLRPTPLYKRQGKFWDRLIAWNYVRVSRLFWLFILIASGVCASEILLQVLSLYSGGAVSYLIETDYLEFDTPFPAVTICEQGTSSPSTERIKAYMSSHKLPSAQLPFLKEVIYWNQKFCKSCATCKLNQTCLEDIQPAVKSIRAKCKDLLTDCWWGEKPFQCCDRFLPLETEYGVCFAFNSRLAGNDTTLIVNRKIGLPNLVFSAAEEVGIRVHSPDDMVSVGMENILGRPIVLPLITDFELILKAEQTVSDQSVTTMPPHVRGCMFKDERPSFAEQWPSDRYSFSTCALYCRVKWQLDLCNCTHHLMPKMAHIPVCNIQGLACLYKNKDMLGSVSCDCPMSCDEITYKPIHMFLYRHTGKPAAELARRGTRGQVKLAQLPSSRVRRTAIRHIMGLVVDIGGVGGVFFGASLLSVIEIVYLCCMRKQK